MAEVIWQDPPASGANRAGQPKKWERRLTPLMAHPKRWALLMQYEGRGSAASAASALRRPNDRKGACITPPGQWEFVTRQRPDGSDLYARYLGPSDEDES